MRASIGLSLIGFTSAAGPTSTLLWVQSALKALAAPGFALALTPPPTLSPPLHTDEAAAVYTSAGLARHVGTTPTFATATWLNKPFFV